MKTTIVLMPAIMGLALTACQQQAPQNETVPGAEAKIFLPQGDPVEGRKAFLESRCNTCHGVPGDDIQRRIEGALGPDLGKTQAAKTRDELATSIIAPSHAFAGDPPEQWKSGNLSRMGDFSSHMTVRQWIDLVAYVKSLDK
jgi:mono/diheme cytochrome c family protein